MTARPASTPGRCSLAAVPAAGGLGALAWVALKVGALSYGGGFVIIPLMQGDAVDRYGWMTDTQFAGAVALGQVTPGPVIHTVTAVGYAAAGVGGALLAAVVAFAPSFAFVLAGAGRFDALRDNAAVRAFLDGAGPAAIGAILGSARAARRRGAGGVAVGGARGRRGAAARRPARGRAHAAPRGRGGPGRRARRRPAAAMSRVRRLVPEVLLSEPQFRLLFAGQVLSLIGDRVMLVALPFAVLEAGGDLEAVGLVVAAELVPFLIFALVGGVVSDRSDRRRILIASDVARLVVQAVGGVLLIADAASPLALGVLAGALRHRRRVLPARVHRPAAADRVAPRPAPAGERAARHELLGLEHRRAGARGRARRRGSARAPRCCSTPRRSR